MEITHWVKGAILFLRLAVGWLFTWEGIIKLHDATWSAKSFLLSAKTFPQFYEYLAQPNLLHIVDAVVPWALIVIGLSIMIGFYLRFFATLGMVMMALFYFPNLDFPHIAGGGYIVDRTLLCFFILLVLYTINAGGFIGIDKKIVVKVE